MSLLFVSHLGGKLQVCPDRAWRMLGVGQNETRDVDIQDTHLDD